MNLDDDLFSCVKDPGSGQKKAQSGKGPLITPENERYMWLKNNF